MNTSTATTSRTIVVACIFCGRDLSNPSHVNGCPNRAARMLKASEGFVPEWRRRAIERVERDGNVAVVDTTNL